LIDSQRDLATSCTKIMSKVLVVGALDTIHGLPYCPILRFTIRLRILLDLRGLNAFWFCTLSGYKLTHKAFFGLSGLVPIY
jgi:hypothetical protein